MITDHLGGTNVLTNVSNGEAQALDYCPFGATVIQDEKHEEAYLVTKRDIKVGEELTQNYLEFESEEDLQKRGISL